MRLVSDGLTLNTHSHCGCSTSVSNSKNCSLRYFILCSWWPFFHVCHANIYVCWATHSCFQKITQTLPHLVVHRSLTNSAANRIRQQPMTATNKDKKNDKRNATNNRLFRCMGLSVAFKSDSRAFSLSLFLLH